MSKKQTKRIKLIIIFGAVLGLILSIFFIKKEVSGKTVTDGLQSLINTIDSNKPIDKIFEGGVMKENIYQQALKSKERETAEITYLTLDQMSFTGEPKVDKKDLIKILYNSNRAFRQGINKSCKDCDFTKDEIEQSYQNVIDLLNEAKISKNSKLSDKEFVEQWVNSNFSINSDNQSSIIKFNKANLGEDVFLNGVASDSDYDLQIDMQSIGNLLFESFIPPIETIFFNMPKTPKNTNTTNNQLNTTNSSEQQPTNTTNTNKSDQNAIIKVVKGTIAKDKYTPENNPNKKIINKGVSIEDTIIEDKSIQDFITNNELKQNNSDQNIGIQGNLCSPSINPGTILPPQEKEEPAENIEGYIDDTIKKIYEYNTPDNNIPNIKVDLGGDTNGNTNGNTTGQSNQYIEDSVANAFNDETTKSCLKECDILPIKDKVICQIQCLCFSINKPDSEDPKLKNMNDMLKLRFCMVPADSMAIPRGKIIYSLDEILTRINITLGNLINGGNMMKYQKTKEYLDSPIADFKFDKILSFQVNLNIKPMFNNKSETAKKDQKKSYINKLEKASGKEQTLGMDYNKYIIISDPIKNKVYKEYAISADEYLSTYFSKAKDAKKRTNQYIGAYTTKQTPSISVIDIKNKPEVLTEIVDFLDQNLKFRKQTETELINLNNITRNLQESLQ